MSEWIFCKDRMPKYGEYVLACSHTGEMDVMRKMVLGWESHWDIYWAREEILAWQPLPDPPQGESDEQMDTV